MAAILKGVNFGKCFISAGTLNFFGEGWRMPHRIYQPIFQSDFDFTGATFISKTTTLEERRGNMELREDLQPKELFPDCIKVYCRKEVILNAVGLAGPGAEYLFETGKWQARREPTIISFATVGKTKEEKWLETRKFAILMQRELPRFNAPVGLEINISCPNKEKTYITEDPIEEATDKLTTFREFLPGVPLILKVNVLIDPLGLKCLALKGLCDAISVSNTIPYGQLSDDIDWEELFGKESPLKKYGGGGLSGRPLLPIVARWITRARHAGIAIPIIGGGGILCEEDVDTIKKAAPPAQSPVIAICSAAILKPWKVADIIHYANTGKRRNADHEGDPDPLQPNFCQPFGPTFA